MARRRKRAEAPKLLIFEVLAWEPNYTFSVNRDPDRLGDYVEYLELHLDAKCVYPDKLIGRSLTVTASSRRGLFAPSRPRGAPLEESSSLGTLRLPPSGGSFYFGVPHESCSYLMSGFESHQFQFLMLSISPLARGRSSVNDVIFARTSD